MGLDWIVEPKAKPTNVDVRLLETKLSEVMENINSDWVKYCEDRGEEVPFMYPNDLHDSFSKLASTVELDQKVRSLRDEIGKYFISPAETLGAPHIGVDLAADAYIKEHWDELSTVEDGVQLTIEQYIEKHRGKYILEAVDASEGIAKVSGILADSTSFRGKTLGFVKWLPHELKERAYEDMSCDELYEYGQDLQLAADEVGKEGVQDRYVDTVHAAARWCMFWGAHGHGMHAWY